MPEEHESMASQPMPAPAPVAAPSAGGMFMKREMNGASFLSLEHVAHMILVVVVASLVVSGLTLGLNMWMGNSSVMGVYSMMFLTSSGPTALDAMGAVSVVAALLVFAPLLMVLDRRTRAEWMKRHGYTSRVAYKVPVYIALGVLVAAKLVADVVMVGVVLNSLIEIGVPNAGIGEMYLTQFVPAAIAAVVFGFAAWYVFKLAKGRDMGRQFSMLMVLVSGALSLALLITAVSVVHSSQTTNTNPYMMPNNSSSRSLENLFNY